MSRHARASIQRLQPYQRRKNPALWALWMLQELSDVDKHRLTHLTGILPRSGSFEITGTSPFTLRGIEAFPGPIEEGTLLVRVLGDIPNPADMQVKANIAADVAFDQRTEARSVRGLPVLDVLGAIRHTIGFDVLQELDTELMRRLPRGTRLAITIDEA